MYTLFFKPDRLRQRLDTFRPSLAFFHRYTSFLIALLFLTTGLPSTAFAEPGISLPPFKDFSLPDTMSLCGEPVPLEDRRVREMLDREFTISVWDRAQVFLWLKRAGRYFPFIENKLAEAGMCDDLKYLAVAESALLTHARSSRGAAGPWQFMTRTARQIGLRKNRVIDERRNFELSTEAALKYLRILKEKFGTWTLAMAAYNCGEARLRRILREQKEQGGRDYYRLDLPTETERYIFRIASTKIIMENPERYGYRLKPGSAYKPFEGDLVSINVRVRLHLTDLSGALGTDLKTFQELNPQFIGFYLPRGTHRIKVPLGSGHKVAGILQQLTPVISRSRGKVTDGKYRVQPGDTLGYIAQRTGVSISTLRVLNGIQGSLIRAGEKLKLTP